MSIVFVALVHDRYTCLGEIERIKTIVNWQTKSSNCNYDYEWLYAEACALIEPRFERLYRIVEAQLKSWLNQEVASFEVYAYSYRNVTTPRDGNIFSPSTITVKKLSKS